MSQNECAVLVRDYLIRHRVPTEAFDAVFKHLEIPDAKVAPLENILKRFVSSSAPCKTCVGLKRKLENVRTALDTPAAATTAAAAASSSKRRKSSPVKHVGGLGDVATPDDVAKERTRRSGTPQSIVAGSNRVPSSPFHSSVVEMAGEKLLKDPAMWTWLAEASTKALKGHISNSPGKVDVDGDALEDISDEILGSLQEDPRFAMVLEGLEESKHNLGGGKTGAKRYLFEGDE